jgi:hypothetical protein
VPGTIPGVLGVVAFGGIKFVGYSLAVSGLKKFEPAIVSSATKIAAVRTGLGVVLGPLATLLILFLIGLIFFRSSNLSASPNSPFQMPALYGLLFIVRIFVWAFVLFLFTNKAPLPRSSFWLYALLGAMVSSLLDWPGYALAIAAPGKIVFC